jgi:putative hydrolase of the HAD superfamily
MVTINGVGVLFDLDDTLLDHAGSASAAVRVCAARWGLPDDAGVEQRWRALERHFYQRFQAGELSLREQRRARIRAFLSEHDLDDRAADELFDQFRAAYRSSWRAFPDAASAVDAAYTAGLVVGVFTNGERMDQLAKWRESGLSRAGVRLIASSELPAAKPTLAAFRACCRLLGVPADASTTMVGDSWDNDIVGALGAGLGAVYLNRTGPLGHDQGVPRIRSLADMRFARRECPYFR